MSLATGPAHDDIAAAGDRIATHVRRTPVLEVAGLRSGYAGVAVLKGLDLSVDTTWSAQFRVVGQPNWRPVDGTVTIDGAPVTVAVLEAKPQLVR